MTLVLTNDDGIDAPGIRALSKAVNGEGVLVAPRDHYSGCGHQVTTTIPIEVEARSRQEYAIAGTPADCVRVALSHLVPGIAISQYKKGKIPIDWDRSARWTMRVIAVLRARSLAAGKFWNVNLPYVEPDAPDPEIVFCHPCTQPLPVDFQIEGNVLHYCGNYASRKRDRGSDVDICLSGGIAITQLSL